MKKLSHLSCSELIVKRGKKIVLSLPELSFAPANIHSFLGLNAAGKTSLLRVLAGIAPAEEGKIFLDGKSLDSMSPRERAQKISFLPQGTRPLWPFSVKDFLLQGRYPHRRSFQRISSHERAFFLEIVERLELEENLYKPISEISGGEFQRCLIARALIQEANILILDEPFTSLDLAYEANLFILLKELAQEGHTIILALHDIWKAKEKSDFLYILADGTLRASGASKEVLTSALIKEIWNLPY